MLILPYDMFFSVLVAAKAMTRMMMLKVVVIWTL
jgi:hypothetical protein